MVVTEPWVAVVLAAGQGERLGGVAKPLIRLQGEALIVRLLRSLWAAGAQEVVCVTARHGPAIQQTVSQALPQSQWPTHWVEVAQGLAPAHSLLQGLAALPAPAAADGNAPAVMVCLADQPFIDTSALHNLLQAYAARPFGCEMVLPWTDNKPGNPVVITPSLQAMWLQASPQQGAPVVGKAWREQHPAQVYAWPTPQLCYAVDIDTPGDVASLRLAGFAVDLPHVPD